MILLHVYAKTKIGQARELSLRAAGARIGRLEICNRQRKLARPYACCNVVGRMSTENRFYNKLFLRIFSGLYA